MDRIFSESFGNLGNLFGSSGFGSSIDLREQKDKYVARVYVPSGDTSKVSATVENGALHVTTQSAETKNGATSSENSEEIVTLPQAVKADQLQLERKQNMVVITIPKMNAAVAAASPQPTTPLATATASPATGTLADWDQRMFDQMKRMQTRMDEVFHQAFPNDLLNGSSMLRLGSTVKVDDEGDKYVVHFTLPKRDLNNANVKFENGRLTLTAHDEKNVASNANSGAMQNTESGDYEQIVTLPGPVKESEMKVDRKNGGIVATLPKAYRDDR